MMTMIPGGGLIYPDYRSCGTIAVRDESAWLIRRLFTHCRRSSFRFRRA